MLLVTMSALRRADHLMIGTLAFLVAIEGAVMVPNVQTRTNALDVSG